MQSYRHAHSVKGYALLRFAAIPNGMTYAARDDILNVSAPEKCQSLCLPEKWIKKRKKAGTMSFVLLYREFML